MTSEERPSSILFAGAHDRAIAEPAYLGDLNLDQLIDTLTTGRQEYDLRPLFCTPLHDAAAVTYRHEVLHDLERAEVREPVTRFAERMRAMREQLALAEQMRHERQAQRWFLDAVGVYCSAVSGLSHALDELELHSRGLQGFHRHLERYVGGRAFAALSAEVDELRSDLSAVAYAVHIKGNRVTVRPYADEPDQSAAVEETFARFKRGAVRDYRARLPDQAEMDQVEERVLDCVAELEPELFARLARFRSSRDDYLEPALAAFDREAQFYLAWLQLCERLCDAGLAFCYPRVSASDKQASVRNAFDVALASSLPTGTAQIVRNDFALAGEERIAVVTGPNQGGKTTFARMVGQLHHLAGLGLTVPAEEASLFLPDRIFTHFEREEALETLRGKLEDELVRLHEILGQATGRSLLIMNESFSSTTLEDALFLGGEVVRRLEELDALAVYVTFVDELASASEHTVSMVAGVVPDDPGTRTFRIERRPADGLAYASAIAAKYGLSYAALRRKLGR